MESLGPGARHLEKEATFPQPVSVPMAILAPAGMSPQLGSVYFEYSVAS